MAGRYLITEVQLGMLIAFAKNNSQKEFEQLAKEIEEKQYLGNSNNYILDDVRDMQIWTNN